MTHVTRKMEFDENGLWPEPPYNQQELDQITRQYIDDGFGYVCRTCMPRQSRIVEVERKHRGPIVADTCWHCHPEFNIQDLCAYCEGIHYIFGDNRPLRKGCDECK